MCSILLGSVNSSIYKSKKEGEEMNIEDEEMLEEYLENCLVSRNDAMNRGQLVRFVYFQGMTDIVAQILTDKCDHKKDDYKGVA